MPIINTVNTSELFHDLKAIGRENFSYEGAKALMEYLEQLSDDLETPIDYDPIAFCCWYSEYGSYDEAASEYFHYEPDPEGGDDENEGIAEEFLNERTQVIEFNGGIIIADF